MCLHFLAPLKVWLWCMFFNYMNHSVSYPYAPLLISLMLWKSSSLGGLMALPFPWWHIRHLKTNTNIKHVYSRCIWMHAELSVCPSSPLLSHRSPECADPRCRSCRGSRFLLRNTLVNKQKKKTCRQKRERDVKKRRASHAARRAAQTSLTKQPERVRSQREKHEN